MEPKKITIDFETRSEVSLKDLGPWAYAEHPSTEIMCIGYKIGQEAKVAIPDKFRKEVQPLLHTFGGLEYFKRMCVDKEYIFEAHNAEFERAIWHHICHKRWGWPDIPIERWRCSAAKAAAHSLPRALGKACAALGLPVQKDAAGNRLMLSMCKPRKPKKAERQKWIDDNIRYHYSAPDIKRLEWAKDDMPVLWKEDKESLIALFKYCIQDVEAEECLSNALRDLSLKEQKLWYLDQKINQRGVKVDTESAQAAIDIISEHEDKLKAEFQILTNRRVSSPKQVGAFKDWLWEKGVEIPNLQKDTVEKYLEDGPALNESAFRALQIRQSLSKSSTAKFKAIINRANSDGRAQGLFKYHGANPGRWSGKGIQPQNLVRSEFQDVSACIEIIRERDAAALAFLWGDPMRALASCMRGMLTASQGKDLICADFSSIEAIVLAWLAGELKVLAAFIKGLDLYKIAAASIYHTKYNLVTKKQRGRGKVAVLASGYQGGVNALQTMAKGYDVSLTDEEAEEIKTKWREAHPNIVQFWWNMENTVKRVIRTGKSEVCEKGLVWGIHGDFLHCKLPSGRLLSYYKPCLRMKETPWKEMKETISFMGVDSKTTQWTVQYTYGGKLVENIVQAVARDLLADAMVRVEEAGYPIVLHVHDEIVSEVPQGFGSVKEYEALMSIKPHWAEGCPIKAEGWRAKRYKK